MMSSSPWITSVGSASDGRRALVSWPAIACSCSMITGTGAGSDLAIARKRS